jgi:hypothetical protein
MVNGPDSAKNEGYSDYAGQGGVVPEKTNKHNVFTNPIGNLARRIQILCCRIHYFWEIIHIE